MNGSSEPMAVGERPAVTPVAEPEPRHRSDWAVTGLFVLAFFYTLYLTSDLLLPVVLALLLNLLLSPLVGLLRRIGLPLPLGAAVVVLGLLAILAYAGLVLSGPASDWMRKAPQMMSRVHQVLEPIRERVEQVNRAAQQVEHIADTAPAGAKGPVTVQVSEPNYLRNVVLGSAQHLIAGALILVFLLYFTLASGDLFLRKMVRALPTLGDKRRLVEIARRIEREISTYLTTVTIINTVLGVVVGVLMHLLGMPNPVLWGTMAGLLNFVPYLGPMATLIILTVASLLTFPQPGHALLVPGTFLLVTSLEGQVITPMVLGRRLALYPVNIVFGLVFWGWLWGIPGTLLAVPILVASKIVCDHIEALHPLAELLGRHEPA